MSSSGYGSQAVSSQTLSSEDSSSVRSMSIDDTPENGDKSKTDNHGHKGHGGQGDNKTEAGTTTGTTTKAHGGERDSVKVPNNLDLVINHNETANNHKLAVLPVESDLDLMDSKVPSNLGSPIKPVTTPKSEPMDIEDDEEILKVTVSEANADANNKDNAGETASATTAPVQAATATKEDNTHGAADADFYSETAMEELENLSDEVGAADAQVENHTTQAQADNGEKAAVKGEEESKVGKRRGWGEEKEGAPQPSIWEEPYKPGQTEVRLRKGGTIDVGRPGSVKTKIRAGEKQGTIYIVILLDIDLT